MLSKHNIKKPSFDLVVVDDCISGPRSRQVLDSFVYDFYSDTIAVKWQRDDMLLVYTLIMWELSEAHNVVADNYKPIFHYGDRVFNCVSEELITQLCSETFNNGWFELPPAQIVARSQIVTLKCTAGDFWEDVYYRMQNNYVK